MAGAGQHRTFTGLMMAATIMLAAMAAHAQQKSAEQYLEPIVTHRQFSDLMRPLDLTREQRMITDLLFEDYRDALDRLLTEADAEADRQGRQIVLDAFAGRRFIEPAELRARRLAVLNVYQTMLPRADEHLANLLDGLDTVLSDQQRPLLKQQLVTLRRELHLHPRQRDRHDYAYAGEGVDLIRLAEDAAGEDGELDGVAEDQVNTTLAEYAAALDRLIRDTAAEQRSLRMAARIARVERDREALREIERARIEHWKSLDRLNREHVEKIATLIARHGSEHDAARWRSRFNEACYPWLYADRTPDLQYDWLSRQDLGNEQSARIEGIYDEYLDDRQENRRRTIDLMREARLELGMIVHAMMDPSQLENRRARRIYEDLLRLSGELSTLESRTSAAFESAVGEHHRMAMRRAIRR